MMKERLLTNKLIILVVLLAVAILSATVVSKYATSPEKHATILETLEEKKETAMKLTAAITITSTAISAIPGDTATFIAQQISELADALFIVVCALYLEQFLFTTIGHISFGILIPIVCILGGICIFYKSDLLKSFAIKLLIFALAIYWIVPLSVNVMRTVEGTFEESISKTFESVDDISEEAQDSVAEEDSNKFLDFMSSIGDKLTGAVENAKNALGIFTDAIAVLVITTCVIPIAVILFFVWLLKTLFGISIKLPKVKPISHMTHIVQKAKEEEGLE